MRDLISPEENSLEIPPALPVLFVRILCAGKSPLLFIAVVKAAVFSFPASFSLFPSANVTWICSRCSSSRLRRFKCRVKFESRRRASFPPYFFRARFMRSKTCFV